jgi:hypothetical protein
MVAPLVLVVWTNAMTCPAFRYLRSYVRSQEGRYGNARARPSGEILS